MEEQLKTLIKTLLIRKIKSVIGLNVLVIIIVITVLLAITVEVLSKVPVVGDEVVEEFLGSEDEIRESGYDIGMINLDKVSIYTAYESQSIPKDFMANVKTYRQNHDKKVNTFNLDTTQINPSLSEKVMNISEICYPYRLWWQALGGLDIHLTSSDDVNDTEAIELMVDELSPVFVFTFENGEFVYNEISKQSVYKNVKRYEDGKLVSEKESQEDILTITPLPYLEKASTMFHEVDLDYKEVHTHQPWTVESQKESNSVKYKESSSGSYTKGIGGYNKKHELDGALGGKTYDKVNVKTVTTIERKYDIYSYEISENKIPNTRFADFANTYDFNGRLDDQQKTFIVDYGGFLPNAYDFLYNANDSLNYRAYSSSGSGYIGSAEVGSFKVDDEMETEFSFPIQFAKDTKNKWFTISSGFGPRQITVNGVLSTGFHGAIDIPIPIGTPILAAKSGIIEKSLHGAIGGNTIVIDHEDGYKTTYMHLSQRFFKKDDEVVRGDVIGISGNTGRSTGPHLHFSIHKDDQRINPLPLLPVLKNE